MKEKLLLGVVASLDCRYRFIPACSAGRPRTPPCKPATRRRWIRKFSVLQKNYLLYVVTGAVRHGTHPHNAQEGTTSQKRFEKRYITFHDCQQCRRCINNIGN